MNGVSIWSVTCFDETDESKIIFQRNVHGQKKADEIRTMLRKLGANGLIWLQQEKQHVAWKSKARNPRLRPQAKETL